MSQTFRTFIAVELPSSLQSKLGQLQEDLRKSNADVSWVKPENIHITLKFLGNITAEKIEELKKALDKIAGSSSSFSLKAKGIGVFPKPSFPRVVWVGIENQEKLKELALMVEDELSKIGFQKEQREFTAHLTIGRVRSPKNKETLRQLIEKTAFAPEDIIEAKRIILFQSTLTPKGSVYTPLFEADL